MQKGDIVKFKTLLEKGDETARMVLEENPDGGRVLVRHLVDMAIQPTTVYPTECLVKEDTEMQHLEARKHVNGPHWFIDEYSDTEGHTIADEVGEKYVALFESAPELLRACKSALADLEGLMPDFEPSGERQHPAWITINDLQEAIAAAERGE